MTRTDILLFCTVYRDWAIKDNPNSQAHRYLSSDSKQITRDITIRQAQWLNGIDKVPDSPLDEPCQKCGFGIAELTFAGNWLCNKCFECAECGGILSDGYCEQCQKDMTGDENE